MGRMGGLTAKFCEDRRPSGRKRSVDPSSDTRDLYHRCFRGDSNAIDRGGLRIIDTVPAKIKRVNITQIKTNR